MSKVSRIFKNSLLLVSAEIGNKILALILTIMIARYLGDFGFGQYSFIITMTMLFQIIAEFGLDYLVVREISKDPAKTGYFLSNTLALKFVLAAISFLLMLAAVNVMNKSQSIVNSVYLAGISIIFFSLANVFNSVFGAHEKLGFKAFLLLLARLIVFVLTLSAIKRGAGLVFLIGIILLSELIRFLISVYLYERYFTRIDFKIDFGLCKRLLADSFPFALLSIIALIYFKIDIVMLSLMKSDQVVGWYSAAYSLLAALIFIADAYNQAIYPTIVRSVGSPGEVLFFCWERSVKYLFLVSLPIAVATTILADRIITIFFSASYEASVSGLRILIWTLPWIFVNSINMRVLYASNKQKKATVIAVASMLFNIILNFLLIPRYSYIGASLATVISEIMNVSLFFWLVFKHLDLKLDFVKLMLRPVAACALWAGMIYVLRGINLAVLVVLGAGAYVVFLLLLKVFDDPDKMMWEKIISGLNLARRTNG